MNKPTSEMYAELQEAFEHFNQDLFGGRLPFCLITLQRQPRTMGFFSHARFVRGDKTVTDEIALNPEYFAVKGLVEILQTIAHEMAHLWQQHFGKPGRRAYHNKEWADFMEGIGLMPSSTGEPGGKRVGDTMADYVIPDGPFDQSCKRLMTRAFRISWYDRFPAHAPQDPAMLELLTSDEGAESNASAKPRPNGSNRVKYRCPKCENQVWGKPGLMILCGIDECYQARFTPVI